MKRLSLYGAALLAALALIGCASPQVVQSDAQAGAVRARAEADKARSEADKAYIEGLETMSAGAGDGPRLAAIMAAFTSRQSLAQSPPVQIPVVARQPDLFDRGFQLFDFLLRGYQVERGAAVSMRQSDNARDMQLGAYGAMEKLGEQIQAPAAPQANETTMTWTTLTQTASGAGAAAGGGAGSYSAASLAGPGVIGGGSYTANPNTQTTSGSYNPARTTTQGAP
ncbi:MAG: hypothetical protein IPG66_05805 [Hydrogenophilales bacterium]|nr:hypothetical protein [Hydrogenophilales bacterium]